MVPKGGQGLTTAGRVGCPCLMRPSEALLCQISALPAHVRTWLRMGIGVQPTPLEIKAIMTVVTVAVYFVKGPVCKNWAKPRLQVKIGSGNCKTEWYFGQVDLCLAMTLVPRRLGALWVVRWYPVTNCVLMAVAGSGFRTNKSTIEI